MLTEKSNISKEVSRGKRKALDREENIRSIRKGSRDFLPKFQIRILRVKSNKPKESRFL
jgi:hypothetical protein